FCIVSSSEPRDVSAEVVGAKPGHVTVTKQQQKEGRKVDIHLKPRSLHTQPSHERPHSLADLKMYKDTKILVAKFLEHSSSSSLPPEVQQVVNNIKCVIKSDEKHMEEAIFSASVIDQEISWTFIGANTDVRSETRISVGPLGQNCHISVFEMIGFGANRRGGRMPSFILILLMVLIGVLAFNYWTVSNKHGRLLDELAEIQTQVKRSDAARSRLEKRNSELIVQVDTHKKQIDQKDGDYSVLEGKLQAREGAFKKCSDEKMKLQSDVTAQLAEAQRLREQLTELKQEFMKQEEQLREVKRNGTNMERKLEYESLQCGRQIAQLKGEYEETKKALEKEVSRLRL
ncbi:hypothetical protein XENOCAPTIV_018984, partial [Xenoophorus captivus]